MSTKLLIFEYCEKDIISTLETGTFPVLDEGKNLGRNLFAGDVLISSLFMAGKNSPFPYNSRGDGLSLRYLQGVYYREKGEIPSSEILNLLKLRYGEQSLFTIGRCLKSLTDLIGPLIVSLSITDSGEILLTNTYTKVYDINKEHNRSQLISKIDGHTILMQR